MKILLINPPYHKERIFRKSMSEVGALLPPLGLAYIASVLEEKGHTVKIIDGPVLTTKKGYTYRNLKEDLIHFNPSIVGVTATSPQIRDAIETINIAKEADNNIVTLLGGPHITSLPQILSEIKSLDYGIYGEGEHTFLDIVSRLRSKKKIKGLKGVIWREGKKIRYLQRDYILNIDKLPFPARHLLPMNLYRPSPANYRRLPATQIMTSRGCPYSCVFCHKPIFGKNFRPHSAEWVLAEIEHLINRYGIKDLQIFDDAFTLDKKRAEDICSGIIERKLDIVWNCMTRVDRIDENMLRLMKKAGCYEIGYGVESGSERILKMIKKGITKEKIIEAFALTKKHKIDIRAFFMIGFPTETRRDILDTISFAKKLNPDVAQFMVTTPYPDTELWEMCKKYGQINIGDWSNFTFYAPQSAPFVPFSLKKNEIEELYLKAIKSFYFRPKFILNQLLKIKSISDAQRKVIAAKAVLGM